MELLNISEYFNGFEYPKQLKKLVELGLEDFDLWFLMDSSLAKNYTEGLKQRFPARHLAPFAKRADNDDVACFEIEKPGKVVVIHDFCEPGFESRMEYNTFWDWFREAINEMILSDDSE